MTTKVFKPAKKIQIPRVILASETKGIWSADRSAALARIDPDHLPETAWYLMGRNPSMQVCFSSTSASEAVRNRCPMAAMSCRCGFLYVQEAIVRSTRRKSQDLVSICISIDRQRLVFSIFRKGKRNRAIPTTFDSISNNCIRGPVPTNTHRPRWRNPNPNSPSSQPPTPNPTPMRPPSKPSKAAPQPTPTTCTASANPNS